MVYYDTECKVDFETFKMLLLRQAAHLINVDSPKREGYWYFNTNKCLIEYITSWGVVERCYTTSLQVLYNDRYLRYDGPLLTVSDECYTSVRYIA